MQLTARWLVCAALLGCGPGQAPRDTPVAPYEQPVTLAAPQPPIPTAPASASARP